MVKYNKTTVTKFRSNMSELLKSLGNPYQHLLIKYHEEYTYVVMPIKRYRELRGIELASKSK